jgi:hypothetical protein
VDLLQACQGGPPHADLRRLALVRLFERQLLGDARVQAALRWRGDDPDPDVRRVAFLLSLYTREKLLRALRERDPELHRQLAEMESGKLPALPDQPAQRQDEAAQESGAVAAANPAALVAELEGLVQRGLLPAEMLGKLKPLAHQNPLRVQALIDVTVSRIRSTGRQPPQAEEENA